MMFMALAGERRVEGEAKRTITMLMCLQRMARSGDLWACEPVQVMEWEIDDKPVPQRALIVILALLPHVRSRPQLLPVLVVFLVQISFSCTIVCGIDGLSDAGAGVGAAAVGEIGAKDKQLTFHCLACILMSWLM